MPALLVVLHLWSFVRSSELLFVFFLLLVELLSEAEDHEDGSDQC